MAYYDYSDVKGFLHDEELIRLLCADRTFSELLEAFAVDDFLALDRSMKVPFFAEVRDYVGAAERADSRAQWIVKPISVEDALGPAMGAICFFLDFFTHTMRPIAHPNFGNSQSRNSFAAKFRLRMA